MILPFIVGVGWIFSAQWHRTACLTRFFREARLMLGEEGVTAFNHRSEGPTDDPDFIHEGTCAKEKLPLVSESITLPRLESLD